MLVGLLDELGLRQVAVAGYDIGSRIAQTLARTVPDRVTALVIAPPLPGAGKRVLTPTASIGWYRAGSGTVANSLSETAPASEDRIAQPTVVLWPAHDPLFPLQWADRVEEFFSDVTVSQMPGAGHFSPLEAPEAFAAELRRALLPAG